MKAFTLGLGTMFLRRRATALLACLMLLPGIAWTGDQCDWATSMLRGAVLRRARAVQPEIRNAPARELNISDEEVREIQAEIDPVVGHVTVSIGTVVTGCPCEEGKLCTDQVWVYAYRGQDTVGLQLSKVSDHWKIGVVQQWWIDHKALARKSKTPEWDTDGKLGQHIDQYPKCGVDAKEVKWIRDNYGRGCNERQ